MSNIKPIVDCGAIGAGSMMLNHPQNEFPKKIICPKCDFRAVIGWSDPDAICGRCCKRGDHVYMVSLGGKKYKRGRTKRRHRS